MRRLRLELSLSSRSVTIGTAALAYLHDAAACRLGGEKKTLATVGERRERERERERGGETHRKGMEGREKEKEKSKVFMDASFGTSGMHLLHGSWPRENRARTLP